MIIKMSKFREIVDIFFASNKQVYKLLNLQEYELMFFNIYYLTFFETQPLNSPVC
ncbi:hypothetical protein BC643_3815 [Mangrovibacterium diazotrophicum]|uniref:Uncharacterized protein n=1 Tax=Mangrovibacterium diazotrophicum TaxID=1261403 RepID=A0A419VX66_9BACT|nr:hypothetical protein BC643_3815 [Mangrovibacterium diazotrophicum]